MKSLSLLVSTIFCVLFFSFQPQLQAQSVSAKKASMNRYVNKSFSSIFGPVSREALQPQSAKAFGAWLNKAAISPKQKSATRKILARFTKGKQEIKYLKISGVTYKKTGKKGDAFIIIFPTKVQKLNGARLDVIRLIEDLKAQKNGDDEFEFESGESCFCANPNNCDCVSCTGNGCDGCGGCGSSGDDGDELLGKAVWW